MTEENIELKKLKFKARRGMLELDILLKNYLNDNYINMSDDLKQQFELLMELTDPELLDLLVNENSIAVNNSKYSSLRSIIENIISNK